MWFWVGDHDSQYCRPVVHALYAFIVPFVRRSFFFLLHRYSLRPNFISLSKFLLKVEFITRSDSTQPHIPPAVILIRVYAFTGRCKRVLVFLCLCLATIFVVQVWLFGTQYVCKSPITPVWPD